MTVLREKLIKEEEGTRKRKLGIRKKMKSKKRKFTSKDDEELRLCLTIVSDEDKEYDETEEIEDVYLNVVIRSNRQKKNTSGDNDNHVQASGNDEFWKTAKLRRYELEATFSSSRHTHTIMNDDGIVIHMLICSRSTLQMLEPEDSDGDEKVSL
ncbi:hypothetical protein Tco_0701976 [Tanacetum coccineum]|uniref:Uncharacterized protein n=1 Tax=Tanacetum coccineum TaxID=301880 RepID=A0ABQ4XUN6_9ASTR